MSVGETRNYWLIGTKFQFCKMRRVLDIHCPKMWMLGVVNLQFQDGGVEGHACTFCCKNTKIANTEQSLTGECWNPLKKYTPQRRAKEKPQQDNKKGTITFKIKPHTHQRCLEGTNKTLCTTRLRERCSDSHQRLNQTCLWVLEGLQQRHELAEACCGDRGSGNSNPGRHSVWHKSFWRRSLLAPL